MKYDEMIAVIQAHKEGKKIQSRDNRHIYGDRECDWTNTDNPSWDFSQFEYRINPIQPHYRPFKNANEVIKAIQEYGHWFHKKNTKFYSNSISIDDDIVDFMEGHCYTFKGAFDDYEFTDGTPFGVKGD